MAQLCLDGVAQMIPNPERCTDEIVNWVCESIGAGFAAFQISFMFKQLLGKSGTGEPSLSAMTPGIYRFYCTAVTRFHRRPNELPLDEMLRLFACPDWPVGKDEKKKPHWCR